MSSTRWPPHGNGLKTSQPLRRTGFSKGPCWWPGSIGKRRRSSSAHCRLAQSRSSICRVSRSSCINSWHKNLAAIGLWQWPVTGMLDAAICAAKRHMPKEATSRQRRLSARVLNMCWKTRLAGWCRARSKRRRLCPRRGAPPRVALAWRKHVLFCSDRVQSFRFIKRPEWLKPTGQKRFRLTATLIRAAPRSVDPRLGPGPPARKNPHGELPWIFARQKPVVADF